jgi:UDP-N-acetylglucosamine 2-epimerase (non-hydrolysing)
VAETLDLSTNKERFDRMSALHNPYGDGKACQRIVQEILHSATATAQHHIP